MVLTGLDLLFHRYRKILQGKRIGLLANPSSINRDLRFIVDLFAQEKSWRLTTLFGPEHGLRAEMQDQELCDEYIDVQTGLKVYSLYGNHLKPTPEMLENVDIVVFDMQDVGSRYYTFIYTLSYMMEACGEANKEVMVLDRPNPINGEDTEGPVLEDGFESFVGRYKIPIRHGMTVGELANLFAGEFQVRCRLEVIRMERWIRSYYFEDCQLPWVLPSPNMPTVDTAIVYPGMCLLEATNLSEGRGTTRPFEIFGAPWIAPTHLCNEMEKFAIPGCRLRPMYFRPTFNKFKDAFCGGAQIHITDRKTFPPVKFALCLLHLVLRDYREHFQWKQPPYEFVYDRLPIDILWGNSWIREDLERQLDPDQIELKWKAGQEAFSRLREKYLLY